MLIYLIPSILTILIYYCLEYIGHAFYSKCGWIKFLMPFTVLILMAMFRIGIGVDYGGYITLYNNIKLGYATNAEIGFVSIVKFIIYFFDEPRIMFALFSLFTLANMLIAIYKQSNNLTFSVFLFIAMGYYNLTYNSIRYYYALSWVFLSYAYIQEHKHIRCLISILIAALFHKTALIVVPVVLLFKKKTKYQYVYLMMAALFALTFKNQIRNIAFYFYPSYLGSVYDGGSVSIFNIIKGLMILGMGYCFNPYVESDEKLGFLYRLNIVALIIYVCCSWIPELSRIGFYFNITSIVFIPNLQSKLKIESNKKIVKYSMIGLFAIYLVIMLSQSYSDAIQLLPYRTWLFG